MNIPPVRPWFPPEDRELVLERISEIMESGMLSSGKYALELADVFGEYIGAKYAIAVANGTCSIEISLRALGVSGKEVLVPTNTFFATAGAVLHAGGKVRFIDSDSENFSIDVDSLRASISENTAGLIVVHIGGIVTPRMAEIQQICRDNDLFLIEDAAHAHGAALNGKKAGTFGVAASFSFYPTKIITAGEGGVIVTDDENLYREALIYHDQGKADAAQNLHTRLGYNWRLSEPHAILGLAQVARLDEFIATRARLASIYDEMLTSVPSVDALVLPGEVESSYYKYIAMLDESIDRDRLRDLLFREYDVSLGGEVYATPLHLQPIFADGYHEGQFPKAEKICRRHICLPLYVTMTDEEAQYVVTSVKEAVGRL